MFTLALYRVSGNLASFKPEATNAVLLIFIVRTQPVNKGRNVRLIFATSRPLTSFLSCRIFLKDKVSGKTLILKSTSNLSNLFKL